MAYFQSDYVYDLVFARVAKFEITHENKKYAKKIRIPIWVHLFYTYVRKYVPSQQNIFYTSANTVQFSIQSFQLGMPYSFWMFQKEQV